MTDPFARRGAAAAAAAVAAVVLALVAAPPVEAADPVTVSGTVATAAGPGVEGRVQATFVGGGSVEQALAPDGSFALELEPGTWSFDVDYTTADESYYGGVTLYGVEVSADMVLDTTRPEDSLFVTVESTPGTQARADVELDCRSETDGAPYEIHRSYATSEIQGWGTLWGIPDGGGNQQCRLSARFQNGVEVGQRIHLDPEGDDAILLRLSDLPVISGSVTLPDDVVVGDLSVQACDLVDSSAGEVVCSGRVDVAADGSYALPVLPGYYEYVELQGHGDGTSFGFYEEGLSVTEDVALGWNLTPMSVEVDVITETGAPATGLIYVGCDDLTGQWYAQPWTRANVLVTGGATLTMPVDSDVEWQCWIFDSNGPIHDFQMSPPGGRAFTIVLPAGRVLDGGLDDNLKDADGVPDMTEQFGPNGGDGNGDGTPDSEQVHVASLPQEGGAFGEGFPYLTVAGPDGTVLVDVATRAPKGLPAPPEGVSLTAGLVSFVLEDVPPGSTQTVSLYPGSTDGVTGYAKYDAIDGWSLLPAGRVAVHPDRVDVTLTDGGVGDADGVADGRITDPGGPAVVDSAGDTTPPVVTGEATTAPNAEGWYAGDVTVRWTATDDSDVAAPPPDTVVTGQGADVTATSAEVCDLAPAPNCTTGTLSGLRIDRTPPKVAVTGRSDGATYTVGAVPAASCSASDALSGLTGPCTVSTFGGTSRGTGTYTTTARAVDRAGNVRTERVTYRVVYGFDGFLPPLNDAPGAAMSVFRRGSTVTVAFVLRRADGSVIAPGTAPTWLTPQRGARTRAAVNEATYAGRTTSGSRFVLRNGRWEYTWSTRGVASDYVYRLGARLDDGTTHTIDIGVR